MYFTDESGGGTVRRMTLSNPLIRLDAIAVVMLALVGFVGWVIAR